MEYVYQMFRTILYKSKVDQRFMTLIPEVIKYYNNEMINSMYNYFSYKNNKDNKRPLVKSTIINPLLYVGDSKELIKKNKRWRHKSNFHISTILQCKGIL
jgi:hypothetical protein